ncbi:MAG: NIPSNAP family protein [Planctomycetes bacterium]|nr:NIPSNAP family protein [Planctomycetota bacterium]
MLTRSLLSSALIMLACSAAVASEGDVRLYELRVYYSPEGRLNDLHARFRDHTIKLFEKHGMTNVGYFVPVENSANKLVYVLSYPNAEAREKSWKAFMADPDWAEVRKKTEANGPIVSKVESLLMAATDYSPPIAVEAKGHRVFEMRTYTATPGNLNHLHARFRDHTVKLFAKHGIANIAYWSPISGQLGADNTLVYVLAHASADAAKASFDAFRKDPDWIAARKASEEKAGGSLTTEGGVKSEFLAPTDYSPLQ